MSSSTRSLLIVSGALWGLVLAVIPAEFGFRGSMTLSPFLVTAFLGAALSAAIGTLLAGSMAFRKRSETAKKGWVSRALSGTLVGVLQAVITGVLVAFTTWLAISITISGFSVATPGNILRLVRTPEIFLQGWVLGRAVLIYSLVVGLVLSPLIGNFIYWLVNKRREEKRPHE